MKKKIIIIAVILLVIGGAVAYYLIRRRKASTGTTTATDTVSGNTTTTTTTTATSYPMTVGNWTAKTNSKIKHAADTYVMDFHNADNVKKLQQELNRAYKSGLSVDGKIGPKTLTALNTNLSDPTKAHTFFNAPMQIYQYWSKTTAIA